MESNKVGWKIVPNTVTNRMVDFSLIHKLIPCRRFRRRCKVMNTVLKRRQGLKTYSQYVKIKTAVLRNLSDDEETDVSDNYTEDDYKILYKSDLPLSNSEAIKPDQNDNSVPEEKCSFRKSDTDCHENRKKRKEKSEKQIADAQDQCLKISKLGWQNVINTRSKSRLNNTRDSNTSCPSLLESRRTNDHGDIENNLQTENINEHSLTCFKESSLNSDSKILQSDKPYITEEVSPLNIEVTDSNKIVQDVTKLPQIADNNEKPLEEIKSAINDDSETSQSDNHSEPFKSPESESSESIETNVTPVFNDIHEIKDINDSVAIKKVFDDESHSSSSERIPNEPEMSMMKNKNNNRVLNIQTSVLGSTNQPKDSGIEEDSEEEILDNKSQSHIKDTNKIQETQKDIQTTPSVMNQGDNSITQAESSTLNNDLLLENHNVLNKTEPEHTVVTLDKDIINSNNDQEKMQKHKPHPTVTCTEIVNKKYKIISCDTTSFDNCKNSELSKSNIRTKRALEIEEDEQNFEDSISPLTKKRLQQLRRLNLTTESESGLSEDDNPSWNTKNVRDNLLRRSQESPDISDSEDRIVKSKLSILIQHDENLQTNVNSKIEDSERGSTSQSINKSVKSKKHKKKKKGKKSEDKKSVDSLESSDKCITNCVKNNTDLNSVETYYQDSYSDHENSISEQHSVIHNSSSHCNGLKEEFNDENQLVGSIKQVSDEKKTLMHDRPRNLQELINKDNLIHRPVKPSFSFKDIYEDDIFILDIPAMAFEKQLVGKKIILTENKLKLGKQKYKVEYKDAGNISCVFGSKNPHKLFKTVNIKPTARIIAREKIIRTSLLKFQKQYIDESNCTEDDSKIDESETSVNGHTEMKHSVPFKKRRYKYK